MNERIIFPARELVLGFPVIGDEVLLSRRRRKPWQGRFSGLGGNVEKEDLSFFHALKRESKQEAGIDVEIIHMEKRGEFKIFRQGKQMVLLHVVVINKFKGDPKKTQEMGPHLYFQIAKLPFTEMIQGDNCWVNRILNGEFLKGEMYRSSDAEKLIGNVQFFSCPSF